MNCPYCKAQIPDDSLFCPGCGEKIEHKIIQENLNEKSTSRAKPRRFILIILLVTCAFICLLIGGYCYSYNKAYNAATKLEFKTAEEYLVAPHVTILHDEDLLDFVEIGQRYQIPSTANKAYLQFCAGARKNRPIFSETISAINEDYYSKAVAEYQNQNYTSASQMFEFLGNYKDAQDYSELIIIVDGNIILVEDNMGDFERGAVIDFLNFKQSRLLDIIDFPEASRVALSSTKYSQLYLYGTWKDSGRNKYFIIDSSGDNNYNLPDNYVPNSLYRIEDGVYYAYNQNNRFEEKKIFRFTIIDADTMDVYCYKNGETYRMYRQ